MLSHSLWRTILGVAVALSILFYFLFMSTYQLTPQHISEKASDLEPASAPDPLPEFYPWTSVSSFPPLDHDTVKNATIEELCQYFPKDKLLEVQPVLKTGHGVISRARHSLNSTSACLDNVLIFSDLAEEIDGHAVTNVIADIPDKLIQSDDQLQPYRQLMALQSSGDLNDETMSSVEGWKTDKFKFLPSISRAWRMAPEKRWYVFYEGDTHVVWDTVFRMLANFDADVPHYFGSPSPGREGTWFANGGPGYIISRAAMRLLVAEDWDKKTGEWQGSKLAEKYWVDSLRDCCGDSLVGWALHEAGVDLKGIWPESNPHPLKGIPFHDRYWCQPVLSLHKSSEEDLDLLWRWQWERHTAFRPIIYRDIAQEYLDFTVKRRNDWDNGDWDAYRPAEDDPWKPDESIESCNTACLKAEGCFQWTYHLRKCWFVRSFREGRAKEPHLEEGNNPEDWTKEDQRYMSGWDTEKIRKWMEKRPCKEVQWVRPSTERIF